MTAQFSRATPAAEARVCQPAWSSVAVMTCAGYGDPIGSDGEQRHLARLRQAIWRVDTLGIEACQPRVRRDGSVVCVGSELPHTEGPAAGRPNFLSDAAFDYATARLADSRDSRSGLTILEPRLRFNMLSSQPMCFNLFADLRALIATGDALGAAAVRAMFPGTEVRSVEEIVVEAVPTPITAYLGDKTGWDAAIWINGGTGLITIETKYTDPLDTAAPLRANPRRAQVATELGLFSPQGWDFYTELGERRDARIQVGNTRRHALGKPPLPVGGGPDFDQMGRNLLLTAQYRAVNGLDTADNYVLAPAFDGHVPGLVATTAARLLRRTRGWPGTAPSTKS